MNNPFPFQKELPKVKETWLTETKNDCVEIRPGILRYKNHSNPGWTSSLGYDTYYTKFLNESGRPFKFSFFYVRCGSYYEIDILEYPDCRGRDESSPRIHWLYSSRGGKKICLAQGQEPRTLEAAQSLSEGWAELVAKYIMTGKTLDEQINNRRRW